VSKEVCCKQSRQVKLKDAMTKWHVQKPTHRTTQKHAEHQDATDIQNKLKKCVFFRIVLYYINYDFLNDFS